MISNSRKNGTTMEVNWVTLYSTVQSVSAWRSRFDAKTKTRPAGWALVAIPGRFIHHMGPYNHLNDENIR